MSCFGCVVLFGCWLLDCLTLWMLIIWCVCGLVWVYCNSVEDSIASYCWVYFVWWFIGIVVVYVFVCLPFDCFYLVNWADSMGLFITVLFGFVRCVSSLFVVFWFFWFVILFFVCCFGLLTRLFVLLWCLFGCLLLCGLVFWYYCVVCLVLMIVLW